jgi:hypothetical protein
MGIAINPSLTTILTVSYDAAPGVATDIEYSDTDDFAQFFIIDTLPISADTLAVWTLLEPLTGFIRVRNTSGQLINYVKCQQVVAYYG